MNKIQEIILQRLKRVYKNAKLGWKEDESTYSIACELEVMFESEKRQLLEAVIEEIEERKKFWKNLEEKNYTGYEKFVLSEDDEIINLIKKSIK